MDRDLVLYLDERFNRVDSRFDRVEQRLDAHDERFNSIDQRFQEVNNRIDARFGEIKRHTGVLVEGLRHEVHLVAEALTMHIQVQYVQEREYFDRKVEDTHALTRSSYDHLHQRVKNFERNRPT